MSGSNGWRDCATDPPEFKEDPRDLGGFPETAEILLCDKHGSMVAGYAILWIEYGSDFPDDPEIIWYEKGRDSYHFQPTHWRPLPPPPEEHGPNPLTLRKETVSSPQVVRHPPEWSFSQNCPRI